MSDASDDELLDRLAEMWHRRDPVPDGLVGRMQRAARAEVDLLATDWDHELMQLVERSTELAGARSLAAAYLLRFTHGDRELLLRVAPARESARIDGWMAPPLALTVQALDADGQEIGDPVDAGDSGRFALTGMPPGLARLRLEPHDDDHTALITPTFEI